MQKKEDTQIRINRRTYENNHKEERQAAHKVWATSIDRKDAEEIDEFLRKHKLTKVELIYAGFEALQNHYGPKKIE
ncbi:MAG: hypothetical protein K2N50_02665 [Clostridia bacterium]|nr:hypothetical protein [Clostridia bacterium]